MFTPMTTVVSPSDSTGDQMPPTIQCGQDINQAVQCGAASGQVQFQECFAQDNSGTVTVEYTANRGNIQFQEQQGLVFGTFPAGLTTVTARATDPCGLSFTDTFTVNVGSGNAIYVIF